MHQKEFSVKFLIHKNGYLFIGAIPLRALCFRQLRGGEQTILIQNVTVGGGGEGNQCCYVKPRCICNGWNGQAFIYKPLNSGVYRWY